MSAESTSAALRRVEQERDQAKRLRFKAEAAAGRLVEERDEALAKRDQAIENGEAWMRDARAARAELASARQRLDRVLSAPRVKPVTVAIGMRVGDELVDDELGLAINAMRDAYIAAEGELVHFKAVDAAARAFCDSEPDSPAREDAYERLFAAVRQDS